MASSFLKCFLEEETEENHRGIKKKRERAREREGKCWTDFVRLKQVWFSSFKGRTESDQLNRRKSRINKRQEERKKKKEEEEEEEED